jgi:lactate dehydrogenase-like 2-hydroxyacid dehydrogenase
MIERSETDKSDVLVLGPLRPVIARGLARFTVHKLAAATDEERLPALARVGAAALTAFAPVDDALLARLPALKIISNFGVGYDHIDVAAAAKRGVIVTNTPDVLTEEVADTAVGLLICAVRELPQAERFLRAGKWLKGIYPLSRGTLRNRTVGILGMGRIGLAIARRLVAFGMPIVYHSRRPRPDIPYRYYAQLVDMARDVDTLMVVVPGGPATKNMVDAKVLEALGPEGVVVNVARGSVIDEPALIAALQNKTILAAGLDVFADEPNVPADLVALENAVLLPHIGSASVFTREQMDQLVVDNIAAWADGKPPLTPVAETPWRGWK